ncbi:Gfo/Idh/MocA family protein [Jiangella alkaliphila]|uniref:Gfo/Idh/MocA family protein n=1 Tax=Jiangella alkaliphila TaxID=419479 RepID=UPI00389A201C
MHDVVKRFAPAYRKAHEAVHSPDFGAPTLLTINWSSGPFTEGNLPDDPKPRLLLDICVHMLDLARYMFGEVAEVFANQLDDIAYAVSLQFQSGAIGVLGMSGNHAYSVTERTELTGGPGHYVVVPHAGKMIRYQQVADWYRSPSSTATPSAATAGSCSSSSTPSGRGGEPESAIASAYDTMRLHEAIGRSADRRASTAWSGWTRPHDGDARRVLPHQLRRPSARPVLRPDCRPRLLGGGPRRHASLSGAAGAERPVRPADRRHRRPGAAVRVRGRRPAVRAVGSRCHRRPRGVRSALRRRRGPRGRGRHPDVGDRRTGGHRRPPSSGARDWTGSPASRRWPPRSRTGAGSGWRWRSRTAAA